ncbi:ATP-binding cassette domain-containing protein [Atopobiaceae bacterium 24-176]
MLGLDEAAAAAVEWADVAFSYPADDPAGGVAPPGSWGDPVLHGASLAVPQGAFCLLSGATGSGKSTLLRLAKPEVAPQGRLSGSVKVLGRPARSLSVRESACALCLVTQDASAQLVCDTVADELAFAMENLSMDPDAMGRRMAEACCFFGIDGWLHTPVSELSGGRRQLAVLAAAMVLRPRVLLLDEPTAQLDPVSERTFLHGLFRVNRELGVTVVVATHHAAPMVPYATMAVEVATGKVRPVPVESLAKEPSTPCELPQPGERALSARDLWARYDSRCPWVLSGAALAVCAGEVRALVGGNGSGKSTLIKALAGIVRPRKGRVADAGADRRGYVPQDPREVLGSGTVGQELMAWAPQAGFSEGDARAMADAVGLAGLWGRDAAELSGGQRQLLAVAKVLLCRPRTLLLDEPVKGLDAAARATVARLVADAARKGAAVVVATHDLAFARNCCTTVSMVFDGALTGTAPAAEFFAESAFFS